MNVLFWGPGQETSDMLLKQGYIMKCLESLFRKLLVDTEILLHIYEVPLFPMVNDILKLNQFLVTSQLISLKEQPRLWHILTQFSISIFGEYGDSSE